MTAATAKKPEPATHLPVKYIGRHGAMSDRVYNTGNYEPGTIRLIPTHIAAKMCRHADAWAAATAAEAKGCKDKYDIPDPQVIDKDEARRMDEMAMENAIDEVRGMTKENAREYARIHYRQDIDGRFSEEHVRREVITLIGRFGAM